MDLELPTVYDVLEPVAGLPYDGLPSRDSGSLIFMTPTRQIPVRNLHDSLPECQCTLIIV